jgi:hypothetical protein
MYSALLAIHSLLRWVVILTGLAAAGRGVAGWGGRAWTRADDRSGLFFITALDLQFVIGLLLYVVFSPTVGVAMSNPGAAMRDSAMRFFLVEHAVGMIGALALAHIGRVRIRKAAEGGRRHRAAAVFFGLALVLILLSVPWPGMPAGRPLWPW